MKKIISVTAFCVLIFAGQAFAQSTTSGGINGRVVDPQGAIVSNATVKITSNDTNSTVTVTANDDGVYRVTNLQPGTYTVEFSAGSFAPSKASNIIVEVGRSTAVDARLTVGTAEAVVDVTAETPVVNTNDNGNSLNVNQTSINELPINGRRWSNFALLAPGTVPDGTFGLISFRGISGLLNNNTIDGGDNNQAFFSEERGRTRINYVISQSAVREFQINTSNYSAEYGRSAGGVTNAVTKSGTNEFHGGAFYYNRNNANGARNPRAFQSILVGGVSTLVDAKPKDLRQQWGGDIGGPIIKNRLFFYFNYDQQKRNFPGLAVFTQPNYLNTANVACLTAPLGTVLSGCTGNGKGLTITQVNNSLAFINSLTGETPRTGDQTIYFPKIDWNINSKNSFSISYNRMRWDSPNGIQTQAVNNRGRSSFGNDFVDVDSVNAKLQTTFSANMLNEFRFQYGRDFEYQFSTPPLPGEPTTSNTLVGGVRSPDIFLTNGLDFGTPTFLERPKYPDERRYQFADSFTYIAGRHSFKFGGDLNRVSDDISNLRFEAGAYSYNNINDFIIDYTNYLTPLAATTRCTVQPSGGAPAVNVVGRCYTSNYNQGVGTPGIKFHTWDINLFAQDDFRITPRLTVNLGIRWEYIKMPAVTLAGPSTTVIPQDGRTIADATSKLPSDKNNFGPRVGFAYDVFGDGKTSVRGGWGIYYGRIQNSTIYNALVNTGNSGGQAQVSISRTNGTGAATTVNPNSPVFPFILAPSALTFSQGAVQFFSKNFQAPLIHQFDIILERQIARNTSVSVSYIGSIGQSLPTFVDLNYQPSGSTTYTVSGGPSSGSVFTLPFYSRVTGTQAMTQIQSTVSSNYNALVFSANRRFTDGLQFQASYTLASSRDTNQNSATFTQTNSPYDLFDRSYDNGPSNFDVRHKFVASAVWAPKFYKGSTKSGYNYLLNGWSFAPIVTFYSGRPYDGTVSGTSLNNTNGDNRFPLNPRNYYRLPNILNFDARLSKRFRITETVNIEFLGEVFNIANRTHVFGVNSTLYTRSGTTLNYNSAFQQVTTTDSTLYRERQVQLSARLQF
jgi:hypothetical protein